MDCEASNHDRHRVECSRAAISNLSDDGMEQLKLAKMRQFVRNRSSVQNPIQVAIDALKLQVSGIGTAVAFSQLYCGCFQLCPRSYHSYNFCKHKRPPR